MGIGSVTSTNNLSGAQMTASHISDPKIKKYQNEITSVQQQMQKLSSKEELSVTEKTNEREKLRKEISNLNAELKRHQEELGKSQKKEIMLAKLQEDKEPEKEKSAEDRKQIKEGVSTREDEKNPPAAFEQTGQQETVISQNSDGTVILKEKADQDKEALKENASKKETETEDDKKTDSGLSRKEIHAIASADSSVQQAARQGTVIARTRDGIAILKGQIDQDERHGVDTEKNQDALEKMEKKEQKAISFQFSTLAEANDAMKSAAKAKVPGLKDRPLADMQDNAFGNPFINAMQLSQREGQAAQQRFFVSLGH